MQSHVIDPLFQRRPPPPLGPYWLKEFEASRLRDFIDQPDGEGRAFGTIKAT